MELTNETTQNEWLMDMHANRLMDMTPNLKCVDGDIVMMKPPAA